MRDITLADTFYHLFTTRAFATGIPTVLSGTPVVSAYENEGLTQITAGITLGADHDSVGGLNLLTVVATGANGYEAGKDYSLVITTGTVGGVSVVGEVVGQFSIGRSAAAVDLANGTDGLGAIKAVDDAIKVVTDKFAFTVANQVDSNVLAVSGDTTAADNLESQYDATGLTGDTFPSTQAQLGGIANVGSAVHRPALSYTLTVGTQSANTVADTAPLDGTRHEHTDVGASIDLYYEFNVGAGIPSSVQVTGYVTGNNDDLDIYGYDWVAAAWVQIGNIQGSASTSNAVESFNLFVDMVGSGVDTGTVRVRFFKAAGLTSALLAVDQIFVAYSLGVEGYQNAAVWFDSSAGNTNVVVGVDGTARNPVSTEAAVNTLLAETNLKRVEVSISSSITFATSHVAEDWTGERWTLALGGQDVGGIHVSGAAVSGIGTGTAIIEFHDCDIGTCTLDQFHVTDCGLSGTITLAEAGGYILDDCHSAIAGATTPIIDTGAAVGNVNLSMADYHNGVEIRNLNATGSDEFSISGIGQIIYAASSSGTVNQRGDWKVTNTGGVTITGDDNTDNLGTITGSAGAVLDTTATSAQLVDDILDEVNTGATHNVTNSLGKQIRESSAVLVLESGTAQAGGTSTLTLAAGANANDDFYNDIRVVIVGGAGVGQARLVHDYTGSTRVADIVPDWIIATDGTSEYQIQSQSNVHVHELEASALAQVNAEMVDVIATDTYAEPGQGAPAATASLAAKINYMFKGWRNKTEQTATTRSLYDDAGTTVDQKSTVSDDGTTYTDGEVGSGP